MAALHASVHPSGGSRGDSVQAVPAGWALALQGGDVPQLEAARLWASVPARAEMWEVEVCAEAGECCPLSCPHVSLRKGEKVRWS